MQANAAMRHDRGVRISVETWDRDAFDDARKARGLTLAQVAARIDASTPTVAAYSSGASAPSPQVLGKIAEVLGVASTDLAPLRPSPRLHELRWHTGMTVSKLAARIGVSAGSAGAVLRGERPPTDTGAWARVLGVDEDTVIEAWQATRADLIDEE